MNGHEKEVVTVGVCKLITDATDAKIEAQKILIDTELKAIKQLINSNAKWTGVLLGLTFTAVQLIINFVHR